MSIENTVSYLKPSWLKRSYRTLPEQGVGLAIFALISFAFSLFNYWMVSFSFTSSWYKDLQGISWALENWPASPVWMGYHFLTALSIWGVWRRFSFFTIKLEQSLFIAALTLQSLWCLSFFFFQEPLLALAALVLLWVNTLLCVFLFRKKDNIAWLFLTAPFFWILYIMGINMAVCVCNP